MDIMTLVLSSAAIGAVVASVVNGVFNLVVKSWDIRLQNLTLATRLAELKHQQLVTVQDWAEKAEGKARPAELWDPLQTVIGYLAGLEEYRKTGKWAKAEASHARGNAQQGVKLTHFS